MLADGETSSDRLRASGALTDDRSRTYPTATGRGPIGGLAGRRPPIDRALGR